MSLQASSSPEDVQSNDSWFSTHILSSGHHRVLYLAAVPGLPGVGTTGGRFVAWEEWPAGWEPLHISQQMLATTVILMGTPCPHFNHSSP